MKIERLTFRQRQLLGKARNAISRCYNPNNRLFRYYGGRGIQVYRPWRLKISLFLSYLMTLPNSDKPELWLDRVDNDGDYEPGNLRFITPWESAWNRRDFGTSQLSTDKAIALAEATQLADKEAKRKLKLIRASRMNEAKHANKNAWLMLYAKARQQHKNDRQLRKSLGVTLKQLRNIARVDFKFLCDYEHRGVVLSLNVAKRILGAYDSLQSTVQNRRAQAERSIAMATSAKKDTLQTLIEFKKANEWLKDNWRSLKELRKSYFITVEEAAKLFDAPETLLRRIENGHIKYPRNVDKNTALRIIASYKELANGQ